MKNVTVLENLNTYSDLYDVTGLAPVIGYEPWALRTIESIKQSLIDNQPVLIRIHSGATYPTSNEKNNKKLDMESHAVLIVGYDDYRREFDVIDPWDVSWGGSKGGFETIAYEVMPIVCVNATAEKSTRLTCVQKNLEPYENEDGNIGVNLKFGFYVPRGYIIDEKQSKFTKFIINLNYSIDDEEFSYSNTLEGNWCVGDFAEMSIPLGKNRKKDVKLCFNVIAVVEGDRPYKYKDEISFKFNDVIELHNPDAVSSGIVTYKIG